MRDQENKDELWGRIQRLQPQETGGELSRPASEAAGCAAASEARKPAGLVSLGRGNEVKVKRPPPNADDGAATVIDVEFGNVQ